MTCAFLYEPRAAVYTDYPPKMQNINVQLAAGVRKNFQSQLQQNASYLKKNWQ